MISTKIIIESLYLLLKNKEAREITYLFVIYSEALDLSKLISIAFEYNRLQVIHTRYDLLFF